MASEYSSATFHEPVYSSEFKGTRLAPRPVLESSNVSRSTASSGYQSVINYPYSYEQCEPEQGRRKFEELSNIYKGRLLEKPTYSEYMSSKHSSGQLNDVPIPERRKSRLDQNSGGPVREKLTEYPQTVVNTTRGNISSHSNVYQKYSRPETLNVHAKDEVASVDTASSGSYSRLFDREEQKRRKEYRQRVEEHYQRLVAEEKLSPDTASVLSDAFAQAEDKAKYRSGYVKETSPVYQVGIDRSVWKEIDHARSKSLERLKVSPEAVSRGLQPEPSRATDKRDVKTVRNNLNKDKTYELQEGREKMNSPYQELTQHVIENSGKPSGKKAVPKSGQPGQRPEPIMLPEKGFYWAKQKPEHPKTPDLPRAMSTRSVTSERSSRLDPHTYQSYAAGILYSSGRSEKFLNLTRHFSVLERISEIESQAAERKHQAIAGPTGSCDPKEYVKMMSIQDFMTREELKELYTELEEAKKNKEFYYSSCKLDDMQWKKEQDKGLLKKQKSFNDLKVLYTDSSGKETFVQASPEIVDRQTPYYQLSEKYKTMEEMQRLEERRNNLSKPGDEVCSARNLGPYLQIMENAAKMTKERPLYGTHIKEFPVNKYEIHVQTVAQKPKDESSHHVRSISAPSKEKEEKFGGLQRSDSSKESYFRIGDKEHEPKKEAEIIVTPESRITGTPLFVRGGHRPDMRERHQSPIGDGGQSMMHEDMRSTGRSALRTGSMETDHSALRTGMTQRPKSCLPLERNTIRASKTINDLKSKFENKTEGHESSFENSVRNKRPRSVPPNFRSKPAASRTDTESKQNAWLHRSPSRQTPEALDRPSRISSWVSQEKRQRLQASRNENTATSDQRRTQDHQERRTTQQAPQRKTTLSGKGQSLPGSLHAVTGHYVNNRSDDQKLDSRFKFSVNVIPEKKQDVPSHPSPPPPPAFPLSPPPPQRPLSPTPESRNSLASYPQESRRSRTPQFQVKDLRILAENNEFSQSKWAKKHDGNSGITAAGKLSLKERFEGPVQQKTLPSPSQVNPTHKTPIRSTSLRTPSPGKPVSPMRSTSLNTSESPEEDSANYGQLRKWNAMPDRINEESDLRPYLSQPEDSEGSFGSTDTFIVKDSDEENKPEISVSKMKSQFENHLDKSKSEPDLASLNNDPYRPRSAKSQTSLNYDSFKEGLKDKDRHGSIKEGSEIPMDVIRGVPRTISGELAQIRSKWEDGESFGEATRPRFRSKTPFAQLDPAGERPYSSIPRNEKIIARPSHYDPYIPPEDILKEVTSVKEGRKREEPLNKPRKPSSVSKMTLDYFDQIGGEWQQSQTRPRSRSSSRGPVFVENQSSSQKGTGKSDSTNQFKGTKPGHGTGVQNQLKRQSPHTLQTSDTSDFGPPLSRAPSTRNPPIPPPPAHPPPPPPLPRPKHRASRNGDISSTNRRGVPAYKQSAFRHQTTDVKRAQPVSEKDRRRREEDEAYRKRRLEQLYEEERQRKIRQEAADMEARKHSDFFTPSQKSPIPLDRYNEDTTSMGMSPVPALSVPPERRRGFQIQGRGKVLYNFTAQNPRELSLRKGDVVYLIRQIDKNWLEGERHGRVGIFPVSYVEIVTSIEAAKMAAMQSEGQAQAKYNFTAHTSVELSLRKGEFVVLLRRIDDNWFEGKIGNRQGIFPVSYVEVIREPSTPMVTPAPSVITTPMTGTPEMLSPVSYDAAPTPPPQPSPSAFAQRSPTLSFGYRQPSPGGPRSQSSQLSPMPDHDYRSLPRSMQQSPTIGRKPASPSSTMPRTGYGSQSSQFDRNLLTNHDFTPKTKVTDDDLAIKRYRALYAYRPLNEDELELHEGDEVYVSEKCDDGWYVGTSTRTGQFGTFPGNYVQQI